MLVMQWRVSARVQPENRPGRRPGLVEFDLPGMWHENGRARRRAHGTFMEANQDRLGIER
jgi:hypothetical protein